MYKYLFITYGEPGWRGAQIRALRMAKYLPKNEVLFWNSDDDQIIKDWGYDVETIELGLIKPSSIEFPAGIELIIFSDLPSNKLYNYSIFQAAISRNIKIVICEQLYRRGQMKEGVYRKFAEDCDLFLLNSLSYFKAEETNKIKIVPPQIELILSKEIKNEIFKKYEIPHESLLIFGVGYHKKVYEKIKQITKNLENQNNNFYTIVSTPNADSVQVTGRLITIPFNLGDDFFKLLYSADLVMVKFGFLQILESLALHKPTLVLGEGGYVLRNPSILDKVFKKTIRFDLEITNDTFNYINKFLKNDSFREKIKSEVRKLHSGELFGAKKAAQYIKEILSSKKVKKVPVLKRKLAILINNEIIEKKEWLRKEGVIYPLCFVIPCRSGILTKERIPNEILKKKIKDLSYNYNYEILNHSFKELYILSERKYDGFIDVGSWYNIFIDQISNFIKEAEIIYITSYGRKIFDSLIKNNNSMAKIERIP